MMFRVITDAPGQTCNRFWSYVNSVGWAIANRKHVYIIYWDKSIKDYDLLRHNKYTSFPLYSPKNINKIGYDRYNFIVHRLFPNNKIASYFCYKTRLASFWGFMQGWSTRGCTTYIDHYKTEIISLFHPNYEIRNEVDLLFHTYKVEGYFIVGVHMRRGDYKNFLNGKYYFSISQYKKYMYQLQTLYKDKKLCFYISTNEVFDIHDFCDFRIMCPIGKSVAYDLYALTLCDRIIGPISTFSRWASFVGNVPLCFLKPRLVISTDDMFSPIKDYYHFVNGKEIISVKALEERYERFIKKIKQKKSL